MASLVVCDECGKEVSGSPHFIDPSRCNCGMTYYRAKESTYAVASCRFCGKSFRIDETANEQEEICDVCVKIIKKHTSAAAKPTRPEKKTEAKPKDAI